MLFFFGKDKMKKGVIIHFSNRKIKGGSFPATAYQERAFFSFFINYQKEFFLISQCDTATKMLENPDGWSIWP